MGISERRHLCNATLIRILITDGYVLRNGSRKQQVALHDIADLGPVVFYIEHIEVIPINVDLAFCWLVEPNKQFCECGLAGAAVTNNSYC